MGLLQTWNSDNLLWNSGVFLLDAKGGCVVSRENCITIFHYGTNDLSIARTSIWIINALTLNEIQLCSVSPYG